MTKSSSALLLVGVLAATPMSVYAAAPDSATLLPPSMAPQDISGVWWSQSSDTSLKPVKGEIPFTPEGRKIYEARKAGIEDGSVIDAAYERCVPEGTPRVMAAPYPIQIMQSPGQVTLLPEIAHAYRQIFMDVKHTPDESLNPSFMGESVGLWEGDTLVVDTLQVKDGVWLDDTGLPLTEDEIHVVERFRKFANGAKLEDVITIEDSKIFARPWTTRRVYEWRPDIRIGDYVCSDRKRDLSWAKRLPKLPPAVASRPVKDAVPPGAVDLSGYWRKQRVGLGPSAGGAGQNAGGPPPGADKGPPPGPGGPGRSRPVSNFSRQWTASPDGTTAPLQPWALAMWDRFKEANDAGHPIVTPDLHCQPFGLPKFWTQPYPYQYIQTADYFVALSEADHQFVIVYMNQDHPANLTPSWYGNSVGHWDGSTLVVDTVGQNDRNTLNPAGFPKTEALHLIDRMSLLQDGQLEHRITFDDPGVYTKPWDSVWTLDRQPSDYRLIEYVCAENERDGAGADARAIGRAAGH